MVMPQVYLVCSSISACQEDSKTAMCSFSVNFQPPPCTTSCSCDSMFQLSTTWPGWPKGRCFLFCLVFVELVGPFCISSLLLLCGSLGGVFQAYFLFPCLWWGFSIKHFGPMCLPFFNWCGGYSTTWAVFLFSLVSQKNKGKNEKLRRQWNHSLHWLRKRRHIGPKNRESPPPGKWMS